MTSCGQVLSLVLLLLGEKLSKVCLELDLGGKSLESSCLYLISLVCFLCAPRVACLRRVSNIILYGSET